MSEIRGFEMLCRSLAKFSSVTTGLLDGKEQNSEEKQI